METRNVQRPTVLRYESAQYKQKRVLRSFFVVITKKIRERGEAEGAEGSGGGIRRESVMAEGSGAYKWHEWEAVFPENNARGPRGVGFQENADCFPGSLTLLLPSYQFSIRLSLSTFPPLPPAPRYQSSTSSVAETYNPPFAYACVSAYKSPWLLLPPRPSSDPYLAVPTGLRENRTQEHAHRSYYSTILFTLSRRKREIRLSVGKKGRSREFSRLNHTQVKSEARETSVRHNASELRFDSLYSEILTRRFLIKIG